MGDDLLLQLYRFPAPLNRKCQKLTPVLKLSICYLHLFIIIKMTLLLVSKSVITSLKMLSNKLTHLFFFSLMNKHSSYSAYKSY